MRKIDLDSWDRKEHYEFFKSSDYAQYNIGMDIDITDFKRRTKEQGLPFSFAMPYVAAAAMNEIEAFRYRSRDGEVILHDLIHPSITYIAPGEKYFKIVNIDLEDTIEAFVSKAQKLVKEQKEYFPFTKGTKRDDLIFISSIPKISFTHLTHTITLNKDDAVPRISWGKYYEKDNRILLPFNMQVNHMFVDGDHLGKYVELLQEYLDRNNWSG